MDRGTDVVHQTRHDRLFTAHPAPDVARRLENRDLDTGPGQGDGRGQAVGAATHDGCGAHALHIAMSVVAAPTACGGLGAR